MTPAVNKPTSPGKILILALCAIIVGGVVALSLPACQTEPISFIDVLFTSVSTVCVTGLQTIPLSAFTHLGHWVLLILIQIGGLGLMTFSFFIVSLFLNLGMTSKLLAGQLFEFESWSKIKHFVATIIGVTLGMEALGACALYPHFAHTMPPGQATFYAIFHAVSAFCNAGISLFEGNMVPFSGNWYVLSILGLLVFAGGIGFIVWYEVGYALRNAYLWLRGRACPMFNFSLHTKIVLFASLTLILLGTLCLWSIERQGAFERVGLLGGWINALFTSISMRSAGFMVASTESFSNASVLVLLFLMMIGASPGSTGSGIKTTTFMLFCASLRAITQNRDDVELYGRTIPQDQMQKVIGIVTIAICWILLSTFALLLLEPHIPLGSILVEAISAFSTCGITLGITAQVGMLSKFLLMLSMIVGRIGMLTLVLSLRRQTQKHLYRFPEERVLLG